MSGALTAVQLATLATVRNGGFLQVFRDYESPVWQTVVLLYDRLDNVSRLRNQGTLRGLLRRGLIARNPDFPADPEDASGVTGLYDVTGAFIR